VGVKRLHRIDVGTAPGALAGAGQAQAEAEVAGVDSRGLLEGSAGGEELHGDELAGAAHGAEGANQEDEDDGHGPSGVTGSQPVTRTPVSNAPALTTLRQADELARTGDLDAAHGLYARLAGDDGVAREVLAESAVGLYRIGSYREAVDAFRRMNVFARGEEDLRYYFAVALYETGQYREAQKELSCALPFIQVTDDVARYRMKIEQSAAVTVARNF
jgi:tetratricopeptide (TPR) repeat protein